MSLPGPLREQARRGVSPIALFGLVGLVGVAVGAVVLWSSGDGDTSPDAERDVLGGDSFRVSTPPVVVFAGASPAGTPVELPVGALVAGAAEAGLVVLALSASGIDVAGEVAVGSCDGAPANSSAALVPGAETVVQVLVPIGPSGSVCATSTAENQLVVTATALAERGVIVPFRAPVRIADTTPSGATGDGRFQGIGVRPERSTLRLPIDGRFSGVDEAGAVVVSVRAVGALDDGEVSVFAPESGPGSALATYTTGGGATAPLIVPLGPGGEICVSTTGRTGLIVDLLGLVPVDEVARLAGGESAGCPDQTVFPGRRLVALYGTERTPRLGVLGEQDPSASAARLEAVAEPWRSDGAVVLPAFELIATLATGTPEDRGVYNLRSSPEFVQQYVDVARRHGFQVILDLQPGQSDFLTEARYYDAFLRQPDVGLALDPEWRTAPPARPEGGFIGTVDAAEVNQVVEYLARIVAEEDLPEKLLVLHQFEPGMITNRDQIVELPGVAIVLHMDGFGRRADKVASYEIVKAGPPWNMGLKLFYDEDVDLLDADDVLSGDVFDPVPDVITYQ